MQNNEPPSTPGALSVCSVGLRLSRNISKPKPSKRCIFCTTTLTKMPVRPSHKGYPPLRPPTRNNKGCRIINLQTFSGALSIRSAGLRLSRKSQNQKKPSKRSIFCTATLTRNAFSPLSQRVPPLMPSNPQQKKDPEKLTSSHLRATPK